MRRRVGTLIAVGACAIGLGACSSTVSGSDLGAKIAASIAATRHIPVPTVTCPRDVSAKIGVSTDCTMVLQNSSAQYKVTVIVSKVVHRTADYRISNIVCTANCPTKGSGASGVTGGTGGGVTGATGLTGATGGSGTTPTGGSGSSGATSSS